MKRSMKGVLAAGSMVASLALSLFLAAPAAALPIPGTGLDISGGADVVSDYRFRGYSQTDEKAAFQPYIDISHESGLYFGIWASTIDLYDDDPIEGIEDGHDVEIDYTAGWSGEVAPGTTLDAAVTYYTYPGFKGFAMDYAELIGSVAQQIGPIEAKLGGGYFWNQSATGDDGVYLYGEVSTGIPTTPITVNARLGHQAYGVNYGSPDYWEWEIGASYSLGPVTAGLAYVDTDMGNLHTADAGLVAKIGVAF